MDKCVADGKAFIARQIIDHLRQQKAERLLQRPQPADKQDRDYQF